MIKIRQALPKDALQIATINTLGWKKGYRGLLPDAFLDEMQVCEKRIQRTKEQILTAEIFLVAENDTGVVGFLRGGKTRKENLPYPYEIYVFYCNWVLCIYCEYSCFV